MNDNQLRNSSPALQHLVVDTIENILKLADNPGKCADYITSQIREILGVRMIALIQCSEYPEKHQHSLLSVCPERRKAIAKSPEVEQLAELSNNINTVETWKPGGDSNKGGAILSAMGFADSVIVPLIVGKNRVGVLLLLGLMDTHNIESILESLNKLSGVIALVLRNSILYQNLEKKVEERTRELAASEERYRSLFEQASDGIFIADPQGNHVDVNSSGCNMLGYTREEILQLSIKDLVPEENQSEEPLKLKALFAGEKVLSERQLKCRDARLLPVEISAKMLPDGRLQGIVRDITERKQAEEALQKSEQRYRLLVENAHDAIVVVQDGIIKFFNTRAAELTGYSSKELASAPITALIHRDDLQWVLKRQEARLEGREVSSTYSYRVVHKDGSTIWVEINVVVIEWEGRPATLGFFSDITERKLAEEKLKESEARYQDLYDNAPDMFVSVSPETAEILKCNQTLATALGYCKEEIVGRPIFEVYHPDCMEDVKKTFQSFLETGMVHDTKLQLKRKDGSKIDVSLNVSAVRDENGKILYSSSIWRDITDRKRIEEEFRESEAKFRSVVESSPMGMHMYHLESYDRLVFVGANRAADRILDVDNSQFIGKTIEEAFPPLAATEVPQRYRRAAAQGESWFTEQINYKDEKIAGAFEVHAFQTEPGKMVAMFLDITDRKQAEEELEKLAAVVKHSGELVNLSTLEGKMVFLNEAGGRMLGIDPQEVEHVNIMEVIPEHWVELVESDLLPTLMRGDIWEGDLQYKNLQTGNLTDVHAMTFTIKDPNTKELLLLANVSLDITESKRAEDALQQSEAKFRGLVETSSDWIWEANAEGVYTYASPQVETMLGYKPEQVVGKTPFDLMPPEEAVRIAKVFKDVAGKGESIVALENIVLHKNGRHIVLETSGVPVLDTAGKVTGYRGVDRDITERKRAEGEIRKLNEELEQRVRERTAELESVNKELKAFSYSVSHDLRTPLRGIDGFSQALLEDYHDQLDEQGKDYLQRVRAASQHMAQLIDDMLNLSRITRSQMKYVKVDLSAMAESIAHKLKETQPDRKVEFIIKPGLMVKGDTRLLRIVLDNLLGNAWKFTNKQPTARIEFGVIASNGKNAYFIKDDGAGFDMKFANKLFGPFQRLHGVREFEGTGIGLVTVQRIIHRHGGHIWAEGAVEKGATFYFTLTQERRSYEK